MIDRLLIEARIKAKLTQTKPPSDGFVESIAKAFKHAAIKTTVKNIIVRSSKAHGLKIEVVISARKLSVLQIISLRTEIYKLSGKTLTISQKLINGRPVLVFTFTVKKRGIK